MIPVNQHEIKEQRGIMSRANHNFQQLILFPTEEKYACSKITFTI